MIQGLNYFLFLSEHWWDNIVFFYFSDWSRLSIYALISRGVNFVGIDMSYFYTIAYMCILFLHMTRCTSLRPRVYFITRCKSKRGKALLPEI